MAKQDVTPKEEIEKGKKDQPVQRPEDQDGGKEFTQVKNAHATGLGSMGRNDERLNQDQHKEEADY